MDRKELSKILLELVEDETGDKFTDVEDGTDLRSGFRLDSLDMVSLILKTEVRLGIKIDSSDLNGVTTVGQMLDLLQRKLAEPAERKAA
jgi:acyl carrier protein